MMQGDSYRLPIELTHEDGASVTDAELQELEVFIGNTRKLLSTGDIDFDENEGEFYIPLTQQETFRLRGGVSVQARLLFLSGDVVGIDLGTINFSEATSKVVLK